MHLYDLLISLSRCRCISYKKCTGLQAEFFEFFKAQQKVSTKPMSVALAFQWSPLAPAIPGDFSGHFRFFGPTFHQSPVSDAARPRTRKPRRRLSLAEHAAGRTVDPGGTNLAVHHPAQAGERQPQEQALLCFPRARPGTPYRVAIGILLLPQC
jgi:hypothetical protein